MEHSKEVGLSFGLTSGVITTMGLMIGLAASTASKLVVIGGILTIAIADAFSDALGIHMSEESENKHTARQIWTSTIATFVSKFVVAITFLVPVLIFGLNVAVFVNVFWGLSLLGFFSYRMARKGKTKVLPIIREHLLIAVLVIVATYFVGKAIAYYF